MLSPGAEKIKLWREHPAQMVRDLFHVEPDLWQGDVLEAFPHRQRQAMTACKGPGKSATLAWLILNFLLTRANPKIVALSVTWDNLSDGLWAEVAKWMGKSALLKELFTWTATRIEYKEKPENWFASARSWPRYGNPQQQADTIAGLHADNILLVFDEAGGIPISVLAAGEAILASGIEMHIVLAGNPTNQDSALGRAVLNQRHLWDVTEITADPDDPKRSPRVSVQWAKEQIATWGADNPWVLVNVFGRFPPGGLNTLISPDEVRDAQKRHYREDVYSGFPKIMGVDVARFGDDESVIFKRQGKVAFNPIRMRNLDSQQGGSHVARLSAEWAADSIQIDATGGWGAGWYDKLRELGFTSAQPVQFAGKPSVGGRFLNKRAEIWWELCAWIKDGGLLPNIPEMVAGLSTATYTYSKGLIQIEEKDQIKARLGRSPDLEDALACTFAYPVAVRPQHTLLDELIDSSQHLNSSAYDPLGERKGLKDYERQWR